jgi:hypothetical protein
MWEPRPLATLGAFTACNRDIFTFFFLPFIKVQKLAWFGHLERMPEERTIKKITHWKPLSSGPKGRAKKKCEDVLQDL